MNPVNRRICEKGNMAVSKMREKIERKSLDQQHAHDKRQHPAWIKTHLQRALELVP
jgi:hypothetical protein